MAGRQAAALGHTAIGIADKNTVAGVVRAHVAAKKTGLRLVVGSRLVLADAPDIICYPTDRTAWGRLCRLLTMAKSARQKANTLGVSSFLFRSGHIAVSQRLDQQNKGRGRLPAARIIKVIS
jgi:DNA polymerase III alpha subunit